MSKKCSECGNAAAVTVTDKDGVTRCVICHTAPKKTEEKQHAAGQKPRK